MRQGWRRALRYLAPVSLGAGALATARTSMEQPNVHSILTKKPQGAEKDCKGHCGGGPGYATPLEAMFNAPREKFIYLPCIQPEEGVKAGKADYLATVDVDPESPTYSQVIHRLPLGVGDEIHHSGWNACSSCHGDPSKSRRFLILPALKSGNINIVDCKDPRAPRVYKIIPGEEVAKKTGLTYPHTSHCLADGNIMISMMGDENRDGKTGFILLDENFDVKGRWSAEEEDKLRYGYDFWYQPKHNVMVSTEWGAPKAFQGGFDPAHVGQGLYGTKIYFWDWAKRKLMQAAELGTGTLPLEVRFKHDPNSTNGFVGAALESSVYHFFQNHETKEWETKKIIQVPAEEVEGWALPQMPGLITDILLSMDDKHLYFSNWIQGDVRQYNVSDPHNPRLVGQVFTGGSLREGGGVKMTSGEAPKKIDTVKGTKLQGGPQMIQLSLDGKRLYVTNSLFASWDQQFYPEQCKQGSQLYMIDVDRDNGGMSLNKDFLVDFGKEPGGAVLAHEVRYEGGDCSTDIYV